jgi:hypothetical protein
VSNAGSSVIDVLLGDGAGNFHEIPAPPSTEEDLPVALTTADLNGDGIPDLVISHCCGQTDATYLLGKGDGTFPVEQQLLSGSSPNAAAITRFGSAAGFFFVSGGALVGGGSLVAVAFGAQASTPAVNVAPSPASGSGNGGNFTFAFSDSAGYQNLHVVDILINSALDGRHACYIAFVPASNSLYLVDDGGDAGGPYQGTNLPGVGSISNSQCSVNAGTSSVSTSGNTLTLTLSINFQPAFSGNKIFYLSAQDVSNGSSGWQALGTWGVPGTPISGPSVTGMSPARTNSLTSTYSFTFSDTNGIADLGVVNILINSAIDGRHACYLAFVPSTGALYLVDDAGDAAGPYSGTTLPGSGTVSNSQCTVGGPGSTLSTNGNNLTLTLPITFAPGFAGNQVFFLAARNNSANSGWQAAGSVTVP